MKKFWCALRMFSWMTLLTGVLYPLLITLIAQTTMKHKADGSILFVQNKAVGSVLIGQSFESDKYFWSRPSFIQYNPLPSGGSNLSPNSTLLINLVKSREQKISNHHSNKTKSIPSELLFASGSGLDPHIHKTTAYFQMERVALSRKLDVAKIKQLIDQLTIPRTFHVLGEEVVNVLLLNKALDDYSI